MENTFQIEKGVLVKYNGTQSDVIVPDGVVEIGEFAFIGKRSLQSVVLPDSVKTICQSAFSMCRNLKTVVCYGVETIGCHAFYDCRRLQTISIRSCGLKDMLFLCAEV